MLRPETIVGLVSTIRTPVSRFQMLLGMQPGGQNSVDHGGSLVGWDILDNTRTIAKGRPILSGPARTAPKVVGHVSATVFRGHEEIFIPYGKIHRNRALGSNDIDTMGVKYITKQEQFLAQRYQNLREFMINRMFHGAFDILIDGDDHIPVIEGSGDYTIDYQVPSDNEGDVRSTFAGDWQLIATADALAELLALNALSEEDSGWPIKHVWLRSSQMRNLLRHTLLRETSGTSNRTFSSFDNVFADGRETTAFTVNLEAIPWLTFHVYDAGLEINGVYTQLIAPTEIIVHPEPSSEWVSWVNGSEIVVEQEHLPPKEVFGFHAWSDRQVKPAGVNIIGLDNGLPGLFNPKVVYRPTVSA